MKKEELENKLKRSKIMNILTIIIISIIVIIIISIFFMLNRKCKNEDFTYKLSGESENFLYYNAYFTLVNNKYYLHYGEVEINNKDIKKITSVTLKCNDRLIVGSNEFLSGVSEENKGYDELFPQEVVENIDNWYFEIKYIIKDKEEVEILKLNSDIIKGQEVEHI